MTGRANVNLGPTGPRPADGVTLAVFQDIDVFERLRQGTGRRQAGDANINRHRTLTQATAHVATPAEVRNGANRHTRVTAEFRRERNAYIGNARQHASGSTTPQLAGSASAAFRLPRLLIQNRSSGWICNGIIAMTERKTKRSRGSAVTCGPDRRVLVAELRAQQSLFGTDARQERLV